MFYLYCRCKWSWSRCHGQCTPVDQDTPVTRLLLRSVVMPASTATPLKTKVRHRPFHCTETRCRRRVLPPPSDCRWPASRICTTRWSDDQCPTRTRPRSALSAEWAVKIWQDSIMTASQFSVSYEIELRLVKLNRVTEQRSPLWTVPKSVKQSHYGVKELWKTLCYPLRYVILCYFKLQPENGNRPNNKTTKQTLERHEHNNAKTE